MANEMGEDDQRTWAALRTGVVSASDVVAAVGLSKHAKPHALWEVKTRQIDRSSSSEATAHGQLWEERVRRWFERAFDVQVKTAEFRLHPELSFIGATPDGLVESPTGQRLLEIKCPLINPPYDFIPTEIMAQIQTQLEVFDMGECDLVCASVSRGVVRHFRVFRSRAYFRWLEARLRTFWRCVTTNTPLTDDDDENGIRWIHEGASLLASTDYNYTRLANISPLPRKSFPPKVHYVSSEIVWDPTGILTVQMNSELDTAALKTEPRFWHVSRRVRNILLVVGIIILALSAAPLADQPKL